MKKTILIFFAIILLSASACTQTSGTLYSTNKWIDCSEMGGKFNPTLFDIAMKNPIFESVEILVTEKFIKATFGTKIYKYSILSIKENTPSAVIVYNVALDNKKYELSIANTSLVVDGTYAISLEGGNWFVYDIRDIKQVN
jgi:hypothetical protein